MGVDNGETAWDGMLVAEATGNRENAEKDLKASMKQILTDSRWTDVKPEMLPSDLDLSPEQINVSKSPTQWKADVEAHRAQVLQE